MPIWSRALWNCQLQMMGLKSQNGIESQAEDSDRKVRDKDDRTTIDKTIIDRADLGMPKVSGHHVIKTRPRDRQGRLMQAVVQNIVGPTATQTEIRIKDMVRGNRETSRNIKSQKILNPIKRTRKRNQRNSNAVL
jgi:uncharacterized protein YeeX (DUF496 family)